ncbi:tyrosine--tRNA ligase [Microvirga arsenatis]|uniref:Tyrosine--tRNA ligase n=1 Tax=Microvirga arsenatis TaxID=2692265 RepID=A0ABW9YUH4_9HYPH|nr:tyrosine--tRNA ligase [Microvirga arsenatis]NBJ09764.1 tyrosine--tRNA ligase [Microvirga arsenatis]NBJ22833.1 tyrosine--tRNA ligase [Microvirga arsenatis]
MSTPQSEFLKTLTERGFIHQCTDLAALDERLSAGPVAAYIGFDATADSLHVGSLVQIMALRWLQKCGHKPVVLIGGGTSQIGDPSFRDASRPLLEAEQIARNAAGLKQVFSRYLAFGDGPTDAVMVDNADWLDPLRYLPFLRDFGTHFTINRMLSFDSVRQRLEREQPLTLLEFNYMVLQAFDFLELSRHHACVLQMGGSDQWGNIVNGIELARRIDGRRLFGLTTPLITTSAGAKMGKTAGGAVWLNAERLTPYEFWQFWRNTEDDDVARFLRLFTELPLNEVQRLGQLKGAEINEAKQILATEATRLAHGEEAAREAADTARRVFEEGESASGLPTVELPRAELDAGVTVAQLLVHAGLSTSRSDARRLVLNQGARLNGTLVQDADFRISAEDLADGALKLTAGRKRHVLVHVSG